MQFYMNCASFLTFLWVRIMNAINLEAARHLIVSGAVSAAAIECVNGHKWAVTFFGKVRYVLKSERQTPRLYGTLETAIAEIKQLGITRCEVHFGQWTGKQSRHQPTSTTNQVEPMSGAGQ